jgi:serine/threonine-protein kinase
MMELVSELESVHRGRRRSFGLAAGLGLLSLAGGLGWFVSQRPVPCDGGEARLGELWGPAASATLQQAFAATGVAYAAPTFARVEAHLRGWRGAWLEQYSDACLATNVRRDQSSAVMDLRMACLDRYRRRTEDLLGVLQQADAGVVARAAAAVESLPDPRDCADVAVLTASVPEPPAAVAAEVESIRGELSHAAALAAAGRFHDAAAIATPLVERARATGHGPVVAEAHYHRGRLQEALGDYAAADADLQEAYFGARADDHAEIAESAAIALIYTVGIRRVQIPAARAWARHAEVEVRRRAAGPLAEADYRTNLGHLLEQAGDYPAALQELEQALAIRERHLPTDSLEVLDARSNVALMFDTLGRHQDAVDALEPVLHGKIAALGASHPEVAKVHNNLATALESLGRTDEAVAHLRRTLAIREEVLGPGHPEVASALSNVGGTLESLGRYEEALTALERALQIREAALGPDHADVAAALTNRGSVHAAVGHQEEAIADHARALTILERALGPDHHDVAAAHNNLGMALREAGRERDGVEHLERALHGFEKALGPDHATVGVALNNLGNAELDAGRHARAAELYERGLRVLLRAVGPRHPHVAYVGTGLGKARFALGETQGAIDAYEQALAALEGQEVDPVDRAETELALAQALWRRGGARNRDRALPLARTAHAAFLAAGERARDAAAEADSWLRRREAGSSRR